MSAKTRKIMAQNGYTHHHHNIMSKAYRLLREKRACISYAVTVYSKLHEWNQDVLYLAIHRPRKREGAPYVCYNIWAAITDHVHNPSLLF